MEDQQLRKLFDINIQDKKKSLQSSEEKAKAESGEKPSSNKQTQTKEELKTSDLVNDMPVQNDKKQSKC